MATYSTLRNALKSQIETVANVGTVQNRLRYASKWDEYLDQYAATVSGTKQVRGWWLERERVEDSYTAAFGRHNRGHTFVVRGILGLRDGSDTDSTFGDLVDDVMAAITGMRITGAWEVGPTLARVQDIRQFGSVLCHYCEIQTVIEEDLAL